MLFIHSQANRDTRPHLIGGHGDYVWQGGSFADPPDTNLETWFIAGGSAGAALYQFLQPGLYVYLNHNLIDAVLKGAAAHVMVEGEWDNDLLEQVKEADRSEPARRPTRDGPSIVSPGFTCLHSLLRGARAVDSSETSSAGGDRRLRDESWVAACGLFRPSPPPAPGIRLLSNEWQVAGAGRSARTIRRRLEAPTRSCDARRRGRSGRTSRPRAPRAGF